MPHGASKRLPDVSKLGRFPQDIQDKMRAAIDSLGDSTVEHNAKGAHKVIEAYKAACKNVPYNSSRDRLRRKLEMKKQKST